MAIFAGHRAFELQLSLFFCSSTISAADIFFSAWLRAGDTGRPGRHWLRATGDRYVPATGLNAHAGPRQAEKNWSRLVTPLIWSVPVGALTISLLLPGM